MTDHQVVIQTKLGQLRGSTKQSVLTEKNYYAFQGIPFGKPPIGELRFKAPQKFGCWEGIRDALQDGPDPKQPIMLPALQGEQSVLGDEDCLYLNVFMNELPECVKLKKPILFSIHGGGFGGGSGNFKGNGPDYLLYGDVVVVTINYRCGAFGFLSLESEEVPGNAGLKDQVLALKWVHDNIDSFGGDPNNVTIFGISAGGASVSHQLLSPSSRGLFHKAIIQSGFALNPWAIQRNPRQEAKKLAKILGCSSEDPSELLEFLQSVTADDIVTATKKMSNNEISMDSLIFTPCVEVSGAEPFLSDSPDSIMKRGEFTKVPVILGCCVKEGSVAAFAELNENTFKKLNDNRKWATLLFPKLKPGSVEEKEIIRAIWDFYFKGNPISWDNVNDYMLCVGDIHFTVGMEQTRTYLTEKSSAPVYTYLFTYHSRCMCKGMTALLGEHYSDIVNSETCHGADYYYLYNFTVMQTPELTAEDKETIKKHVRTWVSFASSGDPNHQGLGATWRRDSETNPCYMDIGSTWEMKEGFTLPSRVDFWMKLSAKYSTI